MTGFEPERIYQEVLSDERGCSIGEYACPAAESGPADALCMAHIQSKFTAKSWILPPEKWYESSWGTTDAVRQSIWEMSVKYCLVENSLTLNYCVYKICILVKYSMVKMSPKFTIHLKMRK